MALGNRFISAHGFFMLFGIWSVCSWFASDFLAKKRSDVEQLRKKAQKTNAKPKNIAGYGKARKRHKLYYEIGAPAGIAVLMAMCILWTYSAQIEYELKQPYAPLLPADDPDPISSCPNVPTDALRVYMGDSLYWTNRFPHTVIGFGTEEELAKRNFKRELVVDKMGENQIGVSVEVRGDDNKIIATIEKNVFNINTNRALPTHKPRPDKSTLVVYDEEGNEVLNVRYLNRHSFRVSGILHYGGRTLDLPIRGFYGTCSGGSEIDVYVGENN